jgi:hypothetical protein
MCCCSLLAYPPSVTREPVEVEEVRGHEVAPWLAPTHPLLGPSEARRYHGVHFERSVV